MESRNSFGKGDTCNRNELPRAADRAPMGVLGEDPPNANAAAKPEKERHVEGSLEVWVPP